MQFVSGMDWLNKWTTKCTAKHQLSKEIGLHKEKNAIPFSGKLVLWRKRRNNEMLNNDTSCHKLKSLLHCIFFGEVNSFRANSFSLFKLCVHLNFPKDKIKPILKRIPLIALRCSAMVIENRFRDTRNVLLYVIRNIMRWEGSAREALQKYVRSVMECRCKSMKRQMGCSRRSSEGTL